MQPSYSSHTNNLDVSCVLNSLIIIIMCCIRWVGIIILYDISVK